MASKRETIVSFMNSGGVVRLYVDPRPPGATLPATIAGQKWACLDIGLNLPVPIPDLDIGNWGVYGTFSFDRRPFQCAISWDQVHAAQHMVSGSIVSWHAGLGVASGQDSPPTERLSPKADQAGATGARVIDFAEAANRIRLARARKAYRGR